jgi:hypothetical protein
MEDAEDYDDTEMEETQKSYTQYDDFNYDDLATSLSNLERKVKGEAMFGKDPLVLLNLRNELSYVKNRMEERGTAQNTFTEGGEGTVNISGPSGSTTVPSVDFVEDPNNLLPDVLDAYDESFNAKWDDIEDRLSKLKKFSTAEKKRDFKNQMERVQAVIRVVQIKEKLVLDPRNKYVRELIKRSSVKTLKDGTEVLMFRS